MGRVRAEGQLNWSEAGPRGSRAAQEPKVHQRGCVWAQRVRRVLLRRRARASGFSGLARLLGRSLCLGQKGTGRAINSVASPLGFSSAESGTSPWKMVPFNPLLCLGVPTQCQRFQFYRGPWGC